MEGKSYSTISEMFVSVTSKFADKVAYGYKEGEEWKTLLYSEVRDIVEKITCGLKSLGLQPGDRVGIIAQNSQWWAMADYGSIVARGVVTTIYPTLTAKQAKWIAQHAECRFLFCGDQEQTEKMLTVSADMPHLEKIIILDNANVVNPKTVIMQDFLAAGEVYRAAHLDEFEREAMAIKSDDLLTLIYTSGTTGEPKGVMLTHSNLTSNIWGSLQILDASEKDTFLSFLPLSHSFERMAGHYLATSLGATIYYAENINTVADNIREVHPTLMTAVPRFYEKVYAKIIDKISQDSAIKQKIFWWAISVGRKAFLKRMQDKTVGPYLASQVKLADKLVFGKLKERVGGRLRFFISGAAPLSKEIAEFFHAAGIAIVEGYGLTETSPVITVNPLEKPKIGAVGIPIPGAEIKIAPDGEILTRGPQVMLGYFKDEEATREVLGADGWFATGDIGLIDDEGYLTITDRKKNILVTSGGKNVAPQPMENVLVTSKWIEQILAIGDRRKFVSALIVPAFNNLEKWAGDNGLSWKDREELVHLPKVNELYAKVIEESMDGFAQFEKIKKFTLLAQEFTIESGELTPSLKIKRNIVSQKCAGIIDAMYTGVD